MARALKRRPSSLNALRPLEFMAYATRIVSPVMHAAREGHPEAAQWLINAGANVNQTDMFGRTALYLATESRDHKTMTVLLNAGADPDMITSFGSSPLLSAVQNNDRPAIKLLLEHAADINVYAKGYSAVYIAVKRGNTELLRWLLDHGAVVHDELRNAVNHTIERLPDDSREDIRRLIEQRASPPSREK